MPIEVDAVFGLIASIITIINTIKTVYEAAHDASGLPIEFRNVHNNLPLYQNILEQCTWAFRRTPNTSDARIQDSLTQIKQHLEDLQQIFRSVIPSNGAALRDRVAAMWRMIKPGTRLEVKQHMESVWFTLSALHALYVFTNMPPMLNVEAPRSDNRIDPIVARAEPIAVLATEESAEIVTDAHPHVAVPLPASSHRDRSDNTDRRSLSQTSNHRHATNDSRSEVPDIERLSAGFPWKGFRRRTEPAVPQLPSSLGGSSRPPSVVSAVVDPSRSPGVLINPLMFPNSHDKYRTG